MTAELFQEYAPIVFSLIVMEGLLSVDNAMIIAAMVDHLPEKEKKLALAAGLFGAYFFRGLMLFFAEVLIEIWWLKLLGAAYLIYVMVEHLGAEKEAESETFDEESVKKKGFWATVLTVEITDLAFSIDNVIAAVALSDNLWVVILGVFLGILAMRFVAGYFIDLMRRLPILKPTAYVLVGTVGILLIVHDMLHVHLEPLAKFGIICGIIAFAFLYERVYIVRTVFKPVFGFIRVIFSLITKVLHFPFQIFKGKK